MKPLRAVFAGVIGVGLCVVTEIAAAQSVRPIRPSLADPCLANTGSAVLIHAPSTSLRTLSLCDGHALTGGATLSNARPLSLSKGDFNEDGVDDLVSGYASGKASNIVLHRGNLAALWPYGEALRGGAPAAFLPNPRSFTVPEAPDFMEAGDFDADGHQDLVIAQRGSDAIYFLRGDGRGGFAAPKRIAVGGSITAMIAGEINRRDGLQDLILGISTAKSARVLIFEGPTGAIKAQPEIFKMPQPVAALALGHFTGGAMIDLAVGAGDNLVVIQGRDRKLSLGAVEQATVPRASLTMQRVGYAIRALEAGDFTGGGPSVAALGDDGRVHILEHTITQSSLFGKALDDPDFVPTMQVANGSKKENQPALGGIATPSKTLRLSAVREMAKAAGEGAEWTERSAIALPSGFSQAIPSMHAGHVSGSLQEDLLIPDGGNGQLHVLSAPRETRSLHANLSSLNRPSMRLLTSLESENAPTAVLPMRLGKSGLQGLVVLQNGQTAPTVMPQTIPASNIFTVTNTSDAIIAATQPTQYTGPAGSLRAAMYEANNTTGPTEIDFDIPTTDPGYNPATGTFLIQPLSEAPASFQIYFALPPINNTMTIDGYTQPGASPNTLANGDNAKILIQIDGGKATTAGGAGLVPFDDSGSTFRGMDFTGWTNAEISGGTASGAEGIEANGVGDFIEGNFFGTDTSGTLAIDPKLGISDANRIGVFADNGPAFGNTNGGTVIGGTTTQARNILSNNQVGGILFLSTALQGRLEGNFIGLDASGAKGLGNTDDGAGSNGPTIIIGGTLAGDGNVISANGTNVDFNDITNGGQASGSMAQGNLIGTDATGSISVSKGSGAGASITYGPTDETVGGTTPAARNVISGNYYGLSIQNDTTANIVQGNFIGTDITGTLPIGNAQQGFYQAQTDSNSTAPVNTVLGGATAGAGNLISGNTLDGVSISGTTLADSGQGAPQGNTILGNYIGTDVTGTKAVPNGATGISLLTGATNNVIGGTVPGEGNIISYNTSHGVLIDSASDGNGNGNDTAGNTILSNGGNGVRINSGADELISRNSIYLNGALGIALGTAGANLNTGCNATSTGPNNSQNAPVLTGNATTGPFYTATATDPHGNTSEFSNAVQVNLTSGNLLDLVGSFNSLANTTYTIEFFSSPADDSSGYGQGKTYIGSAQVTTGADCNALVNSPVNTNDADMSITLTTGLFQNQLQVGPDFGTQVYTATVTNLGPATATNVVVTDALPAGLAISSLYCDLGPCQSSISTNLGNCTVNGQTVTCNLGTMAAGQTANVKIPVQALTPGSITNTANVSATQTDPVMSNNTASVIATVTYPEPFIDFSSNGLTPNIEPGSVLAGSSDTLVTIYGTGFLPSSTVSVNSTNLPVVSFVDNQLCSFFSQYYCAAIEVNVPASLLTAASAPTITVTNPNPGQGGGSNTPSTATFNIVSACTFTVTPDPDFSNGLPAGGTDTIQEQVSVAANAAGCTWTGTSSVDWVVPLESAPVTSSFLQYDGALSTVMDFAVAPNSTAATRNGTITGAGQVISFSQANGAPCDYQLSSNSGNFTAAGGAGSIGVTTNTIQSGALCSPGVETNFPGGDSGIEPIPPFWITVPLNYVPSSGTVTFNVAANTGPARTGTIMIGGYVYTVNQAAPPCSYVVNPNNALWGASGGSGTFDVTASAPGCAWTATSSDASVASVTSGGSGTGNGTVNYTIAANKTGPQTPTITITDTNGGSTPFSISQASNYTCTFILSPATVELPASGESNFFGVTASNSICQWTATSNNPTAVAISGIQSNAVLYTVGQNTSTQPRTLTITTGCETFTIIQDGTGTTNPVPAITSLQPSSATAGTAAFTLTVNGSGFVNSSVVNFNGNAKTTTFVSTNQLTAAITAADIANAGTAPVTVTNPVPGGGVSNTVNFTITAQAVPDVQLSPTSIAFPSTTVGTNSAAQTVTLKNIGGAALTISGISITGTNPTDFSQTNTCSSSLAAGSSCNISVTFTPASATNFSATLSVADNATGSPQTATLSGTGTATAPVVSLTPSSLTFTAQRGTTSAAQSITFKNTGTAALTITGITIGGANPTDFAQTNTCGSSLTAGSSCNISVTFTPASATGFSATLSMADDATGSPQTVTLTGNGTAAATPTATLSPTSLTFSAQTGTTSTAQAIALKNTGSAALTITSIAIGGTNPTDFAQTNTCGSSLAAGSSCNISVTFTPASATSFSATLSVADNATGSPQTATLSGTGTAAPAPAVSLTPSSLIFTTQSGTTSAAQSVTLKNTGDAALTITGIAMGGANSADFAQTNTCGASLAAGATCSISVTFKPTAAASFGATLSITDNATGSPQAVTLSGTGTAPPAPTASLSPSSLTFSAQTDTTTTAQNVTLANTGNAALTISGISIGGTNPADFAQTNTCGTSLAAGASCTISVTFTPASAATFSASLSIADNASGSPQTVALNGTGTAPPIPTFSLSSTTAPQTIAAGGSAQYSITVTAQNGTFANAVTLAASGLPPGATATFSPTSLTPGSSSATSQLTIQTAAPTATAGLSSRWLTPVAMLSLCGMLPMVIKLRRRWASLVVLALASLGLVTALSGCGGGFGLQTATTYNITITGTSGQVQQTTMVQLTVK